MNLFHVTLFIMTHLTAIPSETKPNEMAKLDCGANALFVLLALEGHPVTVDRLLSALPAHHPQGYSMSELAAASSALGVDLEGVKFGKGDHALDRPAIVFVKNAKGGHFAVARPVGNLGTMVQLIDPPYESHITDYDEVLASKNWTGRVLVRRDSWLRRNANVMIIGSACLTFLVLMTPFLPKAKAIAGRS